MTIRSGVLLDHTLMFVLHLNSTYNSDRVGHNTIFITTTNVMFKSTQILTTCEALKAKVKLQKRNKIQRY